MKISHLPIIALAALPISFGFLSNLGINTAIPGLRANKIFLFRAYPLEVRPGGVVSLDGSGFSKLNNKVYFNGDYSVAATSTDGISMKLQVPETLPEGFYKLTVSNNLGSSDHPDLVVGVKVTNNPKSPPSISKAVIEGNTITLTGEGFASSNNILTTMGNLSAPAYSDGTTLSFNISELSLYQQVKGSFSGRSYKVSLWIYVQNEHGMNHAPYLIEITI